ncbi:DUF427 domain-containing protein [Antarcticimicrobium luteum]|uniref:DUF427 domain-containing protein n=1 Tax=Antarcticimicrobium luteum TaxID=2547397 RepID=UPI0026925A4E
MNVHVPSHVGEYGIDVQTLKGPVSVWRDGVLLATSTRARVMFETGLSPSIYFPREDLRVPLSEPVSLQTFCPFKGTASYRDITVGGDRIANAVWSYEDSLPESAGVEGYVAFMPDAYTDLDLGENVLQVEDDHHVAGPLVDWLMRSASEETGPEAFTRALALQMRRGGIPVSRLSVLIWSLHPQIVGKIYVWTNGEEEITTFAPTYELHGADAYEQSPLRHVAEGRGGVRQRLDVPNYTISFPILQDLRAQGATDYVAMPLPFSDGSINVLTLTSDHPEGFTTANLGQVFECAAVISRFYEVFRQKETAQALLETYVGKRTGARVLGGQIRRGDGDEIDAAIMFCDLRGSTRLEESLGRHSYITLLNQFFDTVSGIVQDNGGEVLKFIGDAVLAVFPAGDDSTIARAQAMDSARGIVAALAETGDDGDHPRCESAIGIAYGGVTYGNVGSRERLDFTVIGHAANIAARLGDYGKSSGYPIVVSEDFVTECTDGIPLGEAVLRNVSHPVRCFGIAAADPS